MNSIQQAKNLLENKECSNCDHSYFCNKKAKEKYNTCLNWSESHGFNPNDMLKILRSSYPDTISGNLVSVTPMQESKESNYQQYVYTKEEKK